MEFRIVRRQFKRFSECLGCRGVVAAVHLEIAQGAERALPGGWASAQVHD